MPCIYARNVNDALVAAISYIEAQQSGNTYRKTVSPRGVATWEAEQPVATNYSRPRERVLLLPERDVNPFFHLMESLWMLAGREDAAFPTHFNKRMKDYSDDGGQVLQDAYGHRWRHFFGFDQLKTIIAHLREDPDSRRAVLAVWSPAGDLIPRSIEVTGGDALVGGLKSKDIPCNTTVYFKVRRGALNMTVCCRSNDIIWGAYGANAVQFSMLQEYVANKLGVEVGWYTQFSDSWHAYLEGPGAEVYQRTARAVIDRPGEPNPYNLSSPKPVWPFNLGAGTDDWDADMVDFFEAWDRWRYLELEESSMRTPFWRYVVLPMLFAWEERDPSILDACEATDWKRAGVEWLNRRTNKEVP